MKDDISWNNLKESSDTCSVSQKLLRYLESTSENKVEGSIDF